MRAWSRALALPGSLRRRHVVPRGEGGAVTAEFAVVLPVVVALLALCVVLVQLAGTQVRLASEASAAARMLARGDTATRVQALIADREPESNLAVQHDGELVCATVTRPVRIGPFGLGAATARADGCALDGAGG